ncbi:MAG: FAD-dependent oxidoreductase [Pirellulaceae bacterium]|nr:FAD-dependent oxidoreductase [Pirellulaceae bacterium]
MKIAIIGAGISGLTAAYRLQREHEVTLLEAADYAGGHTNTIDVPAGGDWLAIDTGFIVFNDRTYPNFIQLLDELGVESHPTSMGFSVRCEQSGLEYAGTGLDGLFAQRGNLFSPRFYRLISDWLRFNRLAPRVLAEVDETLTVSEFFRQHPFSRTFLDHYFLPMGSAVWSCPRSAIEQFPIRFIVQFYGNHGLLSLRDRPKWRVIDGGSRTYVTALLGRLNATVRLRSPVTAIRRDEAGVQLSVRGQTTPENYDHVIFACHSDQALRILGPAATTTEREVLSSFPYEHNLAILHTDASILPHSRRAWASWNYLSPREDPAKTTVTYNMNLLQGLTAKETYCVSLNCESRLDPAKVIRRIDYHHPVFGAGRSAAQRRHPELLGPNRTSFCGAYWGNGFHEDGVTSALAVCRNLASLPCTVASTRAMSAIADSRPAPTSFVTGCS